MDSTRFRFFNPFDMTTGDSVAFATPYAGPSTLDIEVFDVRFVE